jgi:hypothetical protein
MFERFGWAWNVKQPKPEQIEKKRRGATPAPEAETAPPLAA